PSPALKLATSNAVIFQRELVVFSQRMAFPVLRKQNTPQVRMTNEIHAAQIIDFPLMPVSCGPQAGHRRHFGQFAGLVVLPARQKDLHNNSMAMGEAVE